MLASAARLARLAQALAGGTAPGHTLVRPRYFAGQLLGADDFSLEQDYLRHRIRRLNREVIGAGVVGLAVARALGRTDWLESLAPEVTISPMQMLRAKQRASKAGVRVRAQRRKQPA